MKLGTYCENFNVCIQKSQWEIDLLPILSPIFEILSSMLDWGLDWVGEVPPGFGVVSRLGGGGRREAVNIPLTQNLNSTEP